MTIQKDTFIDDEYRYELSDLVYQVKLKGGNTGYLYLLCEHLSQPRALMAFHLLSYQIKIMKAHLDKGHKKLPLVMSLADIYASLELFDHCLLARIIEIHSLQCLFPIR